MRNYIIIGASRDPSAIRDAVFGDVYLGNLENAQYIAPTVPGGIMRKFRNLLIRNSFRGKVPSAIRLFAELKYKDIEPLIDPDKGNYIVFCPGTRPFERISPSLIRKLHRHKPKCPLILYLIDGIDRIAQVSEVSVEKLLCFFDKFDAVYTYDRTDAKRYKLPFIEIPMWAKEKAKKTELLSDLYFCGRDKNRSDLLMQVYDHATSEGIRCNYRITNLDKANEREGLKSVPWTLYENTVDEALISNCILEVLTENNFGATLRYKEAVIYNKKLLTNNPDITRLPYYDARWMRYFEKAEDIDLDWVKRVEDVDYGYKGDFSAEYFLRNIEAMFHNASGDNA